MRPKGWQGCIPACIPCLVSYAGIDFLWRVVLDMPSHESQAINASQAVVRASQDLLIKLYQQRSTDGPVTPALCEHFIRWAAVYHMPHLLLHNWVPQECNCVAAVGVNDLT